MRDKMIRNRRKSGDSVDASIDTHLDDVIDPLRVTFTDYLIEGEVLPDLATLFRILQRVLAASLGKLVAAGDQHLREIDNDIKLRQRRDELLTILGAKVRNFRKMLDSLFGAGSALEMAGLDGRTEQEPMALLSQVERILDRFGDPEVEVADPGFRTFQMDALEVSADFEAEYEELKGLVQELNRENRRSDATVIAKQKAMDRYDEKFRWIAGCLESLYHLAGQHELAERVKPSTRRSGRTEENVQADASSDSGDSADESESDATGEVPDQGEQPEAEGGAAATAAET